MMIGHERERCQTAQCYNIKPIRQEEAKSYLKIPLGDDDATREK